MNYITSRNELIKYALTRLGRPVIRINVADDQIEYCVDDAIQKFLLEHCDGFRWDVECLNIKQHQSIYTLSLDVINVIEILTSTSTYITRSDINAYDITRQIPGYDLTSYRISMEKIKTLRVMLNMKYLHTFNYSTHKIELFPEPPADGVIALVVHRYNDPYEFEYVYDNLWLKEYTTALIGIQWGRNISKLKDAQYVGGASLNGTEILQQYTELKTNLETELSEKFGLPPRPMIG